MVRQLSIDICSATVLTHSLGQHCDENGEDLPAGAPPPPPAYERGEDDFFPYDSRADFELADFLFHKDQMSGSKINELMDIWAAHQQERYGDDDPTPLFANAQDLYNVINGTELGDIPWQAFSVKYNGDVAPDGPRWMSASYEVWFHDPLNVMESQIGNRDFGPNEMDYAPKRVFSSQGKRQFSDLMSGDWAWNQAVCYLSITLLLSLVLMQPVGYHRSRPWNPWGNVCPDHSWK